MVTKVYSCIHNSPSLVPITTQTNPIHPPLPQQIPFRYFNITYLSMPRPSKWSLFPKNPARTSSLDRKCPIPHPIQFRDFYSFFNIFITWAILVMSANQEARQCAISSGPPLPPSIVGPNGFLSYSILKHFWNGRSISAYYGVMWHVWHLLSQMDASVWFNKQCQTCHMTPKYAQIHLKDNNICNIKTNIFRDTPIQMVFKSTNTISPWKRDQCYTDNKFEKVEIYIYIYIYIYI